MKKFLLNMVYFVIFLAVVSALLKFFQITVWTLIAIAFLFFFFKGIMK